MKLSIVAVLAAAATLTTALPEFSPRGDTPNLQARACADNASCERICCKQKGDCGYLNWNCAYSRCGCTGPGCSYFTCLCDCRRI
ncbi:hypothetical protein MN608_10890 [Microdochium nivale]|nr:hypothetical protein MN608_10890 [Microdochium nivale]